MSFRSKYSFGVEEYYKQCSHYENPHEPAIRYLLSSTNLQGRILDLACGSGEVTLALDGCTTVGVDPYTAPFYKERTGRDALPLAFEDILDGALQNENFDAIVCSYAMHLIKGEKLPTLLYQLTRMSDQLVILTPHKRPVIKYFWTETYRTKFDKTTLIHYRSLL